MLSPRPFKKNEKGFTLVEMMVTVAILAILLAVAAPSLQTVMVNMQIRSVSESLMTGLQSARSEALRRNTQVSFWMVNGTTAACALDDEGTSWVVSLDNPGGKCNADASPDVDPRIVQVRAGSEVSGNAQVAGENSAGGAASCITFNGFGATRATCVNGTAPIDTIEITSDAGNARNMRIRITAGGSVRLCDPAVSDADADNPAYCGV